MLLGFIAPPRRDRTIGPSAIYRRSPQADQRRAQISMQGDTPPAPLLGDAIGHHQHIANAPTRIQHHRPGELGNLGGPQPSPHREQDHDAIARGRWRVPAHVRQHALQDSEISFACRPGMTWHSLL
jgi:hypothetical protein